jgi:hypothetical protein
VRGRYELPVHDADALAKLVARRLRYPERT